MCEPETAEQELERQEQAVRELGKEAAYLGEYVDWVLTSGDWNVPERWREKVYAKAQGLQEYLAAWLEQNKPGT